MGLLSFFKSGKDTAASPLEIDLRAFRIGATDLGKPPADSDYFANSFDRTGVFRSEKDGIELGVEGSVLDYAMISLDTFRGSVLLNGSPFAIGPDTTEQHIVNQLGEPYWIDRSDGELILFYEYDAGAVELQFEFPDGKRLQCVTLARHGVLSVEEQRQAYGVDKPWPPAESSNR